MDPLASSNGHFHYSWNASGYARITWNYGNFTSFHFTCNNTCGCYFP